jgi:hypothetical protein
LKTKLFPQGDKKTILLQKATAKSNMQCFLLFFKKQNIRYAQLCSQNATCTIPYHLSDHSSFDGTPQTPLASTATGGKSMCQKHMRSEAEPSAAIRPTTIGCIFELRGFT